MKKYSISIYYSFKFEGDEIDESEELKSALLGLCDEGAECEYDTFEDEEYDPEVDTGVDAEFTPAVIVLTYVAPREISEDEFKKCIEANLDGNIRDIIVEEAL